MSSHADPMYTFSPSPHHLMLEHSTAPLLVGSVVELRLEESLPTPSKAPQIGRHFMAERRSGVVVVVGPVCSGTTQRPFPTMWLSFSSNSNCSDSNSNNVTGARCVRKRINVHRGCVFNSLIKTNNTQDTVQRPKTAPPLYKWRELRPAPVCLLKPSQRNSVSLPRLICTL